MATETVTPKEVGGRTLLIRAAVLTPVLQYFFVLGMSLFSDKNQIRCSNWHGEMLPCTIADALIRSVGDVLLLNVFTMGIALVVSFLMAFVFVVVFEAVVPPVVARSKLLWGGLAVIGIAVLVARAVQTMEINRIPAVHGEEDKAMKIIVIEPGRGGATVVDPQGSPPKTAQPQEEPK